MEEGENCPKWKTKRVKECKNHILFSILLTLKSCPSPTVRDLFYNVLFHLLGISALVLKLKVQGFRHLWLFLNHFMHN